MNAFFDKLNQLLGSVQLRGTNAAPGDVNLLASAGGHLQMGGSVAISDATVRGPIGLFNTSDQGSPVAVVMFSWDPVANVFNIARTPTKWIKIQAVAVAAGTPVSVWTPAAGKKFRVMGYSLSGTVACLVLLEDTTGVEFLRTAVGVPGTVAPAISPPLGNGYLSAAANNSLFLDVSVGSTLSGYLFGCEE